MEGEVLRALLAILFRLYFILFFRLKIYGKKNYVDGSALVAANHASFFDPPLIGASLFPKKIYFLARDSLFDTKLMHWALSNCLTIPVKRGQENASVFRQILKLVKEGKKVALFPEGTRSEDGELHSPKEGIGMMVLRSKAKVIPIYLHGTYEAWSCHKKRPKLHGQVAVVIGRPMDFGGLEGEKKAIHQEISTAIMDKITLLKKWYMEGAKGEVP
jgi:1-acyl-sn-glycerol-3-phosphate acyltransferase